MALAYDNATPGHANASSLTFAHTTGSGSERALAVVMSCSDFVSISSVTYNGVAMTALAGTQFTGTFARTSIYYLANPASGSNNVVITLSGGGNDLHGCAISVTGADQTTPMHNGATNSGGAGDMTITITSATGEIVVDGTCYGGTYTTTPGSGQTLAGAFQGSQSHHQSSSRESGAASVVMDWAHSGSAWINCGASFVASSGTAVSDVPPRPSRRIHQIAARWSGRGKR